MEKIKGLKKDDEEKESKTMTSIQKEMEDIDAKIKELSEKKKRLDDDFRGGTEKWGMIVKMVEKISEISDMEELSNYEKYELSMEEIRIIFMQSYSQKIDNLKVKSGVVPLPPGH